MELNTPLNTSPARSDKASDRGVETLSGRNKEEREGMSLNLVLSLGVRVPTQDKILGPSLHRDNGEPMGRVSVTVNKSGHGRSRPSCVNCAMKSLVDECHRERDSPRDL